MSADKKLFRLHVCDGPTLVSSAVVGRHRVTICVAATVTSQISFTLLTRSSGAGVFTMNELETCRGKKTGNGKQYEDWRE